MTMDTQYRVAWDVRAPTVLPPGLPLERRRELFASWVSNTFTGAVSGPLVVFLNLEDYALEPGELNQLILRVGGDLRAHKFGSLLLVVTTSDPATQEVVRALATTHDVPIYLAPSRSDLDKAVPAAELTSAQREVLDAVGQLGRATASVVAGSVGSQSASVGNILAHLSSAGLLLRAAGAGRIGHTYVHPRLVETSASVEPLRTTLDLPEALSEEIAAIAGMAGRQPGELLAEAWRAFLDRNQDAMAAQYREMAELVRRGDREQLIRATTRSARARARATAPRQPG